MVSLWFLVWFTVLSVGVKHLCTKRSNLLQENIDVAPNCSANEANIVECVLACVSGLHPPGPPLVRPVLPRERGMMDRVIECLVGDGPQNRYALICQQCLSHNGMALKEEFEYIAFRCAYCYFLNPARKTRPQAPRITEYTVEAMPSAEQAPVAMETQPSVSAPAPEEKCTEEVKSEAAEQEPNENQPEEEPAEDTDPHLERKGQSNDEHELSAMEVE